MSRKDFQDREVCKVDPRKVKRGDLMAILYWVNVKDVGPTGESMVVRDLQSGMDEIRVNGKDLIANSLSADFYEKEEAVTMTRLAEILCESPNRPLTVVFTKKDGTERTLRGRWLGQEKMFGRSICEDFDVPKTAKEDGVREVDHRTIQSLTVDGVKYVLKKK